MSRRPTLPPLPMDDDDDEGVPADEEPTTPSRAYVPGGQQTRYSSPSASYSQSQSLARGYSTANAAVAISAIVATTIAWMSGRITNEWAPLLVFISIVLPVSPEAIIRRFAGGTDRR